MSSILVKMTKFPRKSEGAFQRITKITKSSKYELNWPQKKMKSSEKRVKEK